MVIWITKVAQKLGMKDNDATTVAVCILEKRMLLKDPYF
jgi:hypothetical protein